MKQEAKLEVVGRQRESVGCRLAYPRKGITSVLFEFCFFSAVPTATALDCYCLSVEVWEQGE
jgi:hypothetical protein